MIQPTDTVRVVPRNAILCGDALAMLRTLPDESVQCCITSPPYFGLRDYGVPGQLGLEPSPDAYVARLVEVFREVRRVLRSDGVCFVNIGDSYAGAGPSGASYQSETTKRRAEMKQDGTFRLSKTLGERGLTYRDKKPVPPAGLKPKDLCLIPFRLALALQVDGWWVRQDIIWAKPNPMPESVRDRCTRSHEYIFHLAKSQRYYWDAEAIAEPAVHGERFHGDYGKPGIVQVTAGRNVRSDLDNTTTRRNRRDVWTVTTKPYAGAHFATFPPDLVEPCLLAGTSPMACETCGAPRRRVVERETERLRPYRATSGRHVQRTIGPDGRVDCSDKNNLCTLTHTRTIDWAPTCACEHNTGAGRCLVLDPFMGAGTVAVVAQAHDRDYLGIELNHAYIALAEERIAAASASVPAAKPRKQRLAKVTRLPVGARSRQQLSLWNDASA